MIDHNADRQESSSWRPFATFGDRSTPCSSVADVRSGVNHRRQQQDERSMGDPKVVETLAASWTEEERGSKALPTEDSKGRQKSETRRHATTLRRLQAHTAGQGSGAAHERCAGKCGDGQTKCG
jgi:hypothetical protein